MHLKNRGLWFAIVIMAAVLVACTPGQPGLARQVYPAYVVECAESDNGKDFYTPGEAHMTVNGVQEGQSLYDICAADTLIEMYCVKPSAMVSEKYKCPQGCRDGACVKQ